MSIIPLTETFKNTIEVLNKIYEIPSPDLQWANFLKFFGKLCFDWFLYLLSLQWVNDFVKIPIILPHLSESVFSGMPDSHLSFQPSFLESSKNFIGTSFLSGFLNCFFLYFPLSPVHFIWLRYVLLDGQKFPWAGRAATLGLIFGNLSLFGFCLFGFRPIINIWFGFEPLSYFFGVWLVFKVIFELTHSPSLIKTYYQTKQLWKVFLIHFGCVWTDQSGFYQFFGNLSVQSGFSLLDFVHSPLIIYFLGISLGSFFWTFFISQAILQLGYLFPTITKYPYSYWIRGFHSFCLIGCVTLTLTSFGFYGTDYLFTNPLGFLPQDRALEFVSLSSQTTDTKQGRLGEKSTFGSVDTDLSIFDRGRYAGGPVVEFHIESLNYQEEYAWRSRIDRFSSRGLNRGGGILDQYITTQLGPVDQALQKQRKQKKRTQQIQKLKKKILKEKRERELEFIENEISYPSDSEDENIEIPELPSEEDFLEYYEQLIERFIEDYTAEAHPEDPEIPDLKDEKMIRFSAFSELAKYGFDTFSIVDALELDPFDEELTRDIKEKFSENIINKFLVHLDISNFIKRQPKSHQLTSKDEISLFKKRLALSEYFDTLRSYFELPNIYQPLFCGPKSYANRIYNQQFKGTLKIVERLFSIHLEDEENIPTLPKSDSLNQKRKKVKKVEDEFSYSDSDFEESDSVESDSVESDSEESDSAEPESGSDEPESGSDEPESGSDEPESGSDEPESGSDEDVPSVSNDQNINDGNDVKFSNFDSLEAEYLKLKKSQKETSVLKFDQPLYKTKFLKQNPLVHEQFIDQMPSLIQDADIHPFLKEGSSYPFFVGWDNEQRKFVVTNRLLTRQNTLSNITLPKDINFRKFSSTNKLSNGRAAVGPLRGLPSNRSPSHSSKLSPPAKQKTKTFTFTTWPVTKKALKNNPSFSRLFSTYEEMANSAEDIFKYSEPQMEEDNIIYKQLPNIVRRIGLELKDQPYLAPTRGGFIWSGNEPLKYKFQLNISVKKLLENWGFGRLRSSP